MPPPLSDRQNWKQAITIPIAASSSGEEPYSLAAHCLRQGGSPSILSTDISDSCLQKARLGIYPDQCLKYIPEPILKAYCQKGVNGWSGRVRVKPQLRQAVDFQKFNLLKDALPDRQFDAIFCRNVMIYFDAPTKERVVSRLNTVLRPGGFFIIGGAESLNGLPHPFRYRAGFGKKDRPLSENSALITAATIR